MDNNWPFEDHHNASVALSENMLDTPAVGVLSEQR